MRGSFRRRLTVLIAAVFLLFALCLLTLQYFLVKWLLLQAVSVSVGSGPSDAGGTGGMAAVTVATNDTVLRGLQIWSAVLLVLFAALAIVAANFLASRSMSRVVQISATAREISGTNRKKRLDLPGANDEIKELSDTIDNMLDRLDQALTRQESFISAASHELRTPLAVTRTALEVPYSQGKFGEDTRRYVERALEANRKSEELIAGLLTLALAQGTGDQRISPEQARGAYDQTVEENRPLAEEHQVELCTSISLGPTADPGILPVALNNLVKNAIIHGRVGGVVTFSMRFLPGLVEFKVVNEGEIIPAELVAELTQPFNRGRQTRLSVHEPANENRLGLGAGLGQGGGQGLGSGPGSGLGLGLSVADAVAQHLGGALELTPREAGGLQAKLVVPLVGGEATAGEHLSHWGSKHEN